MDQTLAHGENLGGSDLVDHVALEAAHGLSLCDEDDIFVLIRSALLHHPAPARVIQAVGAAETNQVGAG